MAQLSPAKTNAAPQVAALFADAIQELIAQHAIYRQIVIEGTWPSSSVEEDMI